MRRRHSGVSMVELMVVVAIMLSVVAVSIPTVLNAVGNMRLRSSAAGVAALINETRMLAVKNTRFYTMRPATLGNDLFYFVDLDESGTYDPAGNEELTGIGAGVQVLSTAQVPVQLTAAQVGGSSTFTLNATDPVSFNARGLPCLLQGTPPGSCSTLDDLGNQVGFVYYLALRPTIGDVAYKAVSVTPAGRVQTWSFDGGSWQ